MLEIMLTGARITSCRHTTCWSLRDLARRAGLDLLARAGSREVGPNAEPQSHRSSSDPTDSTGCRYRIHRLGRGTTPAARVRGRNSSDVNNLIEEAKSELNAAESALSAALRAWDESVAELWRTSLALTQAQKRVIRAHELLRNALDGPIRDQIRATVR